MDTILKELESKGMLKTAQSAIVQKEYNGFALEGSFFNRPKCTITDSIGINVPLVSETNVPPSTE
jgi:hypothetical protein